MSLFEGRGAPTAADRLVRAEQLEFVSPCGDQGSGDGRHLPVAYVGSVWVAQLEFVSPVGDQGSGDGRRFAAYILGV